MRAQVRHATTQRVTPAPPAGPSGAAARYFARANQRQQTAATRAALQGRRTPNPQGPGPLNPPTLTTQQKKWALGCLGGAIGFFLLLGVIGAIISPDKSTHTAAAFPLAASSSAVSTPAASPTPTPAPTSASPTPSPTAKPSPSTFKVGNYVGTNLASVESQLKAQGINWTATNPNDATGMSPDEWGANGYQVCKQSSKAGSVLALSTHPRITLTVIDSYDDCSSLDTTSSGSSSTSGGDTGASSGATALCNDGTLSYSAHHRGTCSHHGGVAVWYK